MLQWTQEVELSEPDVVPELGVRKRLQSLKRVKNRLKSIHIIGALPEHGEAPTPATSLRRQQQSVSGTAERVWSLSNESIERKNSIARDLGKLPSPSDAKKEGFREALHRKMSRSSTIVRTAPTERDYWGEERPRTREEYNHTVRRMSVTVFGSYRRGSMIGLNPLERFRRAVRQIKFLNAIKFAAEQQRKSYHSGTSSFAMLQQELDDSTQLTNTEGLLFDPNFYKAQRDVHLTNEAICILSINPSSRTEEELNTVITSVKASVPAFGEYPSRMQRQLLSVGWYERFEPNRVIIRQGHRALNFYFILSGSAIVSLMTKDRSTGISKDSTVAILGKGHSFGELALLHDTARTATVVCQSDVSLLAVSRQDFIDIFLRSSEEGEEQEHVRFLRSIPFLKRLPLEECNGKLGICLCHYFRRGVVIDKDPTNSEWIYIVKSGSCRVLTKVAKPRTDLIYHNSRKLPKLKEEELSRNSRLKRKKQNKRNKTEKVTNNDSLLLPSINPLERLRPKTHSGYSSNSKLYSAFLTDERRKTFDDMILKKSKHDLYANRIDMTNSRQGTYIYASKSESDFKKGEEKHRENLMKLVEAHRQEQEDKLMGINVKSNNNEDVFVQTELLKPKDQFGIASLIYHDIPQTKSFLISNGAECVLLSKAWVKKKSTESLLRSLRTAISPFPSTATLQQNLQDRANWENYKSEVIKGIISSRI